MKPGPFKYLAPTSLEEAVRLLAEHGEDAKLIAGGQSLVPMMAFRLATPSVLIDLNRVTELEHAAIEGNELVLGAMSRHRSVLDVDGLEGRCSMLAEGVGLIGHVAIRNRGTVGGSLAHSDPAAEWPALLLALDGVVDAAGPGGRRTIASADLFLTYFTTAIAADEIIAEVRLGLPEAGPVGSTFMELSRRHGDFAIAGVGAMLRLSPDGDSIAEARVVLIGVADTAVRARAVEDALVGSRPTNDVLVEASRSVGLEIHPMADVHASSEYRRDVASVLLRRALVVARDRALARAA